MARLQRILTTGERAGSMQDRLDVEAVAGRGLIGDRYHAGRGTFSSRIAVAAGAREVSLIDSAALLECARRLGQAVNAAMLRRNLVIEGLELMTMRGRVLMIGDVRLQVVSSCPPCGLLSRRLGLDMRQALHGIGGMRAAVLTGGRLVIGTGVSLGP